jgi:glycosyltransferase involved in cell wall biosynthesis
MQLDIGICPLVDNDFNRAKSNIKSLEMSLCKIPCIASDVEPYKKSLAWKLAKTEGEWYEYLTDLVKHPGKRKELGEKAFKRLNQEYDLSYHIKDWIDSYDSLYYNKDTLDK